MPNSAPTEFKKHLKLINDTEHCNDENSDF